MPTVCPAQCDQGQGRCFLRQAAGDVCCNFYLQNNCIDECPSGLANDSNSVCGEFHTVPPWRIRVQLQYCNSPKAKTCLRLLS